MKSGLSFQLNSAMVYRYKTHGSGYPDLITCLRTIEPYWKNISRNLENPRLMIENTRMFQWKLFLQHAINDSVGEWRGMSMTKVVNIKKLHL